MKALLSDKQAAIPLIAAATATGDMPGLRVALERGLDAGLTVSETKEILVRLYAYAGFPRSLNALGELMRVLEERRQRGVNDAPGRAPSHAVPGGEALRAIGTQNQTRISGGKVQGAVFDFSPEMNQFLQTHLFGDLFERDNLDWQSRELATVGALAAVTGLAAQLRSHINASLNVGLRMEQLRQVAQHMQDAGNLEAAGCLSAALESLPARAPGVQ